MKARTLLRQKNIKTNSIDRKKFAISLGLIRRGRFEWRWLPLVVNHMKSVIVNWRDFLFHFEFHSLFEWLSIPLEFEYRENFKRWTHWNLQSPHQVNDDHTFAHTHTHAHTGVYAHTAFLHSKEAISKHTCETIICNQSYERVCGRISTTIVVVVVCFLFLSFVH